MCLRPLERGYFLFLPGKEQVLLGKKARKRARHYWCGERYSLCWLCGVTRDIISPELAVRLLDPDFTLPAPLTREQAKLWTPPTISVDTVAPGSLNVSLPPGLHSQA